MNPNNDVVSKDLAATNVAKSSESSQHNLRTKGLSNKVNETVREHGPRLSSMRFCFGILTNAPQNGSRSVSTAPRSSRPNLFAPTQVISRLPIPAGKIDHGCAPGNRKACGKADEATVNKFWKNLPRKRGEIPSSSGRCGTRSVGCDVVGQRASVKVLLRNQPKHSPAFPSQETVGRFH